MEQNYLYTRDADVRLMMAEEGRVIRDAHFSGAGGSEVVRRRTALIDGVLKSIHGLLSRSGPMPALLAIGGYGRAELNPHSDIDIMFLCRGDSDRHRAPEMLYRLWDTGMDVGHSVRTIEECVDLGRKDIRIRTSLMESRLIAGDVDLYNSFLSTMQSDVFFWKSSSFIQEKIAERLSTRQKFGGSIYLREPNVKEGAGGLRDIHAIFWLAAARFRITSLADLAAMGVLTSGQYAALRRSRNFLWRVRNELHYLSGRKNDHLTFDMQEHAAADFGYRSTSNLLAVERFMKTYFIHVRNISEISSLVSSAVLKRPIWRTFSSGWRRRVEGPFMVMGRTIAPASDDIFIQDPARLLAAFEMVQSRGALFSERMKTLVREARFGDEFRRSPTAAGIFISILDRPERLFETLSLMKDLRFLGRYIPEFRVIQSLARHDYYHQYTVDEHILNAIRRIQELWDGRAAKPRSLGDALRGLRRKWPLMLSLLLHDLGKAAREGHDRYGVEIACRVLERMGIDGEGRERVVFLVKNHLLMSFISQRRELSDIKVIAGFARTVQDRENLSMLYLLTYADISSVNPTAWTQWKAALLEDLYLRTMSYLGKTGAAELEQERLGAAVARLRGAVADAFGHREVEEFLADLPDKYILNTPVQTIVDHMEMMKRLPEERLVIKHRHHAGKGTTELTICAYDVYGMLASVAGVIAAHNLNIVRARAFTTRRGVMIDTFHVTDSDGNIMTYEDVWASIESDLRGGRTASRCIPTARETHPAHMAGASGPPASVEFDNETSDEFTIIDISCRDRVGLLHRIAGTLYDLNVYIASAKIATEGTRVMDSFYVSDLLGKKINDPGRIEKVRGVLLAALD